MLLDLFSRRVVGWATGELEKQMKAGAKRLDFEEAAQLRDRIKELRRQQICKG